MLRKIKLDFAAAPVLNFWKKQTPSVTLDSFHSECQQKFDQQTERMLSFPIRHANFEKLSPYLRHYLNNHGDPFNEGQDFNPLRTRQLEQQVIKYFADLYRAETDKCWGYMASGSTESNM